MNEHEAGFIEGSCDLLKFFSGISGSYNNNYRSFAHQKKVDATH